MTDHYGEVLAALAIGAGLFIAFVLFVLALVWGAVFWMQDLARAHRHKKRVQARQARRHARQDPHYRRKEH